MKPEDLFYTDDYDRISEYVSADGDLLFNADAREALGNAFFDVIIGAGTADPSFTPDADVTTYARTTAKPGRVRHDDVWQRIQTESASEARQALYDLGCPAQPFSSHASEALIKRGTDPSVPNDLSSLLSDGDDGAATV